MREKKFFVYIINNGSTIWTVLRGYVADSAGITLNANKAKKFTLEQAEDYVKTYRI